MTKLYLAEHIVTAAVAKLQAGYPARVTEINAEFTDGIAIAAPLAVGGGGAALDGSNFITSGMSTIPQTPAIVVADAGADFTKEGEGVHDLTSHTRLIVGVLEADTSRERLGKKLHRHARAAIEVLWDDPPQEKLTGSSYRVHPTRTRPGRVFESGQDTNDPWRAWYLVEFVCVTIEVQ